MGTCNDYPIRIWVVAQFATAVAEFYGIEQHHSCIDIYFLKSVDVLESGSK